MTQTVRHTGYGILLNLSLGDLGHPDRPGLWEEIYRKYRPGVLLCAEAENGVVCPESMYLRVTPEGKRTAVHHNPNARAHTEASRKDAREALKERIASVAHHAGFRAAYDESEPGRARITDVLVTGESGTRIGWEVQLSGISPSAVVQRSNTAFAEGITPVWTVDSPKASPINRAPWARLDEVADWKILRSSILAVRGGVSQLRMRECHGAYFEHCPLKPSGWCGGRHARMEPKEIQLDDLIEQSAAGTYVPLFVPPKASRRGHHMWVTTQDKADFLQGRPEPTPTGATTGPRLPTDESGPQNPRPLDPTCHYGEPSTARRTRPPRDSSESIEVADWVPSVTAETLTRRKVSKACPCGATDGVRQFISGYLCLAHAPAIPVPPRFQPDAPRLQPLRWHIEGTFPWPKTETGRCARCSQPCHRYGIGGSPLCERCAPQV